MESMEIDDSFFNRQRYVLGEIGMEATRTARVFLHGLGGVGVEIAKNLCLAGVKVLTVQDDRLAKADDLGFQFFLRPDDVEAGRTRSEASIARLAELNPYVKVERVAGDLNASEDLSTLDDYKCVILTEYTLDLLTRCDEYCRQHHKKLVVCDVFGVFGVLFCDFGWSYKVRNTKGEEPKRFYIGQVTQANPGVVKTADDALHGLEDGDLVSIREVKGMTELEGRLQRVTVLSPTSFSIDVDTTDFAPYVGGGVALQSVEPQSHRDRALPEELKRPTTDAPDLGRFSAPQELHLVHLTLLRHFLKTPAARDAFLGAPDLAQAEEKLLETNAELQLVKSDEADVAALARLLHAAAGGAVLPPLCAFFGGVAAQEALKAVSTVFAPLHQWLYLDARDLLPPVDAQPEAGARRDPRYRHAVRLLGAEAVRRTMAQRLFLVGCGAIGCELLKNLALLGVGAGQCGGDVVITDHDIIEKSNLNRQFLFREHHIRQPKSTVAAAATREINPDLEIVARMDKVCKATEADIFNDSFFESRHICVNALDNVMARLYMDTRCVTTRRPLLESGTMGTKGHVQVIVPHLTETYASQADPPDVSFPYCTLKSFPSSMEHCIQWARDKFESQFVQKPQLLAKFVETEQIRDPACVRKLVGRMEAGEVVDKAVQVSRFLRTKCSNWTECVRGARSKFEKYFNHKALQLLHAYPLDSRLSDGSLFWESPKRPPTPIEFDVDNEMHMSFIRSCARLLAEVGAISFSAEQLESPALARELEGFVPKQFVPSSKAIVTDEKVSKEAALQQVQQDNPLDAESRAISVFSALVTRSNSSTWTGMALPFEKDDDERGHIEFVTAAANLRALMYALEQADRFQVKRIAGRIVPAIATTTAAVAGLVTLELLRLVNCSWTELHHFRNAFLNLALPVFVLSEPGPCPRQQLPDGRSFSSWDRWDVELTSRATVATFLELMESRFGIVPCSVLQGSKIVYMPFLPNHVKRLKQPICDFIRTPTEKPYADLLVTVGKEEEEEEEGAAAADEGDEEEKFCPIVRLYIKP